MDENGMGLLEIMKFLMVMLKSIKGDL